MIFSRPVREEKLENSLEKSHKTQTNSRPPAIIMDSQPCHCRPQTLEDITGYLMLQIDDSLKFSIKSVANKRRIASRLSSNCNGM